jgi:DNA polymerase-3 subunit beta
MEIELKVKDIYQPLQGVIGVVEKRQTLPILSHVLISLKDQKITLTTTDMEIEISVTNQTICDADTSFTVYAKDLIDILRNLKEDLKVQIIIEANKLYIKANKNSFELNTFNHEDFPSLPSVEDYENIQINKEDLKNLIEKTSFSMGNQDIRAYLNGLYLETDNQKITVVASDGHRLSIGEIKQANNLSNTRSVIIPRKAVTELTKILNRDINEIVTIHLAENYFFLKSETVKLVSRLIDGNFPNYSQVIPTNFDNTVLINREDFLDSLHQSAIFVDERNKGVKLKYKNSDLFIFSQSERGQAKTQISTENFDKEIEIAFNIQYLISILEKISSTQIEMVIPSNENQSCLISGRDDDKFQYVVMPMRI